MIDRKMKTAPVFFVLSILVTAVLVSIPSARAAPNPTIYPRTDKSSYVPGDSGILYITVRNAGDQAFTLNSMMIRFPWMSYVTDHRDGNQTVTVGKALAANGGTDNEQVSFTVPSDGRVVAGSDMGSITLSTDISFCLPISFSACYSSFTLVVATPTYFTGLAGAIYPPLEVILLALTVILLYFVVLSLRRVPRQTPMQMPKQ